MKNFFKENLLVIGFLALLLSLSFYDVIFLGKTFKVDTVSSQAFPYGVYGQHDNKTKFIPVNGTDSPLQEEPIYEFFKLNLQKGILALWNPHQGCGYSLIAVMELGLFFPLTFLYYLLPQMYGWDILMLSRFLLGGLFVYWLMRSFKFKKIPSLGAAVIFMLSGPMVLLQYCFTNVEIVAPLLLLSLNRLAKSPTRRNVCLAAICIFLTFLGGHPEHVFFVNVFGFLFFCFRAFTIKPAAPFKKTFSCLTFSYLLGLGLASFVLWPFVQNLLTEFWDAHPPGVGLTSGEIPERLITLFVPYFFQKESLTFDFTFAGWWGGYVGVLPLTLALLGLWKKQKQGLNYFFAFLGFIIIAKEYSFPLVNWIGYLPIFKSCRFYIHTAHLFALCTAILAGMGLRIALTDKKTFLKGLIFSLVITSAVVLNLGIVRHETFFTQSLKTSLFTFSLLAAFLVLLFLKDKKWLPSKYWCVILIGLLSFELFSYILRERPRRIDSYPAVPYIEFLKNSTQPSRSYGMFWMLYPNTASAYEVDDLGIFSSLLSKRYVEFINTFVLPNHFKKDLSPPALRAAMLLNASPYLDLLNVAYLITPSSPSMMKFARIENKGNKPVYLKEAAIYKRESALPRAFIVHSAFFTTDDDLLKNTIRSTSEDFSQMAVIRHKPIASLEEKLRSHPTHDDSTATITKYSPNQVDVKVRMENPGLLVLSDSFHPDWRAYIDGKSAEIFETDGLIRSVYLEEGQHMVRFIFTPIWFYLGLLVSLLSAGILILSLRYHAERHL